MLNQKNKELNFIEKRRLWKSKVDKPLSRRMLIMVLPALVLSVFAMMSAPYLKIMVEQFMKEEGDTMSYPVELDISEKTVVEKEGPPPNPDAVLRQDYRDRLEASGFDWRAKPQVEGPDLSYARERELAVKPVQVELPNTMAELRASSESADKPAESSP